jgi:hypothetical protein
MKWSSRDMIPLLGHEPELARAMAALSNSALPLGSGPGNMFDALTRIPVHKTVV